MQNCLNKNPWPEVILKAYKVHILHLMPNDTTLGRAEISQAICNTGLILFYFVEKED
jgi:hypothetical protein